MRNPLIAQRFWIKEDKKKQKDIYSLFLISFLFFVFVKIAVSGITGRIEKEMLEASSIMAEASEALKECREELGLPLDPQVDVNRTGLIGLKTSPITTSLGKLEAKRTAANPNFAGLTVWLLRKAGVKPGDTIAVGSSGSFPGLIIASLSASKAMGLKPVLICALGASQWGANNPRFHWLQMGKCLVEKKIFPGLPAACSLGGGNDCGEDMEEEGLALLQKDIKKSGISFIFEPDFRRNIAQRMNFYQEEAGGAAIKAFINIGGSSANIGKDPGVLALKPGLIQIKNFPSFDKRGVIQEMASRKIPVIHFLFLKGLAEQYGLNWDPVPLPQPGDGRLYLQTRWNHPAVLGLCSFYLGLVAAFVLLRKKSFQG